MSPPAANTRFRAKTPSPGAKGSPSSAGLSRLSSRLSSNATLRSPPEAKSTADAEPKSQVDASSKRKELLELLMNPKAHEDPKIRDLFSRGLSAYSRIEQVSQSDILLQIATSFFDLKKYKILLLGSAGVGKSTLVHKLKTGTFQQLYEPTHGADVTSLILPTSRGHPLLLELWDTAGAEKNGRLRDGYYIGSDAALVMYDCTSAGEFNMFLSRAGIRAKMSNSSSHFANAASYRALSAVHKDLIRVCGDDIPIVLAANKTDEKKKRKKMPAAFERKNQLKTYQISIKSGLGGSAFSHPLLYLLKKLTGDSRLAVSFAMEEHHELPPSGDEESAIAESAGQLSLEDRPPTPQADVAAAAALALPESEDEGL